MDTSKKNHIPETIEIQQPDSQTQPKVDGVKGANQSAQVEESHNNGLRADSPQKASASGLIQSQASIQSLNTKSPKATLETPEPNRKTRSKAAAKNPPKNSVTTSPKNGVMTRRRAKLNQVLQSTGKAHCDRAESEAREAYLQNIEGPAEESSRSSKETSTTIPSKRASPQNQSELPAAKSICTQPSSSQTAVNVEKGQQDEPVVNDRVENAPHVINDDVENVPHIINQPMNNQDGPDNATRIKDMIQGVMLKVLVKLDQSVEEVEKLNSLANTLKTLTEVNNLLN